MSPFLSGPPHAYHGYKIYDQHALYPMNIRIQRGFVLVLTLWVLVIVAIAAGYFAERVSHSVELTQQSKQNANAMIDMAGTRAEILYRLCTTSVSEYGLGRGNAVIGLDNRAYRGLSNTVLRLQDNRGLLNLNFADDGRLRRLLGLLDIPAEQRGHLIDTLRDFTDANDLHRLNGAEKQEYLAQNLPPPLNDDLRTPWEARRIIGWRDSPQLWQNERLIELTSTSQCVGINPDTAPAEILATMPGISQEMAQVIITRRQLSPLTNVGQLAATTGMPPSQFDDSINFLPSHCIRITQSTQGLPWAIQYNITLTPNSNNGPWQTDYFSRVRTTKREESLITIPRLPPRSTALPEQSPLL